MASTSYWRKPRSSLARALTHTHVSPQVPVSFPKSSSVLQGKGAFVCRHLSEKSLSKRKCVALVVLRTRVLAPAPLCLIVPSLSFFIFVGNDKIQSSSCFIRQHRWDVLLLCYDQYFKYWWLMLLRVFGAFNFFSFFFSLGLDAELYYVRNDLISHYALSFNLLVPSETNFLHFTWHAKSKVRERSSKEAKTGPPRPRGWGRGWIWGVGCQLHKRVSGGWAVAVLGLFRLCFKSWAHSSRLSNPWKWK